MNASVGIWNLILAVIAMECASADASSQRRLFIVNVPTRYYPLALLGIFGLMSGGKLEMSYFLSVGVGYLCGFGKLDFCKLKVDRRKRLEGGVFRKFTEKVGFVPGPNGGDWSVVDPSEASGGSAGAGAGAGAGTGGSNQGGGQVCLLCFFSSF